MALRPYQSQSLDGVRGYMRSGVKNVLLTAGTGAGKTIMACEMIKSALEKGTKVAFIVDRLSLINQTSEVFNANGIHHTIMQAGRYHRAYEDVHLISVQTMAKRGLPEGVGLIIVDEAHTIHKEIIRLIKGRTIPCVGLTATPFTKGLGKYYDAVVNVTTTHKLIADGYLSPYKIFACVAPDMSGVPVYAGEWAQKEAGKRALEVVGDVVAEYQKHGEGRKFICSAVDTAHVEELHRQFSAAGIITANYTYRTSEEEREEMVNEFRKPDSYIRGLITVTAASKGFDVPDVGCIIMARPLRKSLAEHIQLFGRGLRIHPEKYDCIILDHSGNCGRFWVDTETFFSTGHTVLDDGEKKDKPKAQAEEKEPMTCPSCKRLHNPAPVCPACGFEYPKKLNKVEHKAGTLVELIADGAANGKNATLWQQLCSYSAARKPNDDEALKRARGLYKSITKNWPPFNWGFERCDVEIMPAVAKQIQRADIAYFHATKRRAA